MVSVGNRGKLKTGRIIWCRKTIDLTVSLLTFSVEGLRPRLGGGISPPRYEIVTFMNIWERQKAICVMERVRLNHLPSGVICVWVGCSFLVFPPRWLVELSQSESMRGAQCTGFFFSACVSTYFTTYTYIYDSLRCLQRKDQDMFSLNRWLKPAVIKMKWHQYSFFL